MEHLTHMSSLAEQLRELKEEISSTKFATVVLGNLPESYDTFLTSLNARNADDLDWEDVKGLLIEKYMKRTRGVLPQNWVGVRPASQNPYPIYDQNLRFSLPYL